MNTETLHHLFDLYPRYRNGEIRSEFIPFEILKQELLNKKINESLTIEQIGESIERRGIYSLKFGHGRTKIIAWSQMHGDEPTATAALMDIFNFLTAKDNFDDLQKLISDELEIHFIPMLNPDGAVRYQRENVFNIDLNRDALRRQSDESSLLWQYVEKLKPEFGFNLHDQNSYYSAGRTNKSSAISLLAPPMDFVKSINYTREKSMMVILSIYEALNNFIHGHIARYSDDFEPRAFGDNLTNLGVSTVLIESGFYPGDYQKEFVRKLNFISLLVSFASIAEKSFEKKFYGEYFKIPENQELLFDLLLRNLELNFKDRKFMIDVGINRKKKLDAGSGEFLFEGTISDLGDLSTFYGIEEYDMKGCKLMNDKLPAKDDPAFFKIIKENSIEFVVVNGFLQKNHLHSS